MRMGFKEFCFFLLFFSRTCDTLHIVYMYHKGILLADGWVIFTTENS